MLGFVGWRLSDKPSADGWLEISWFLLSDKVCEQTRWVILIRMLDFRHFCGTFRGYILHVSKVIFRVTAALTKGCEPSSLQSNAQRLSTNTHLPSQHVNSDLHHTLPSFLLTSWLSLPAGSSASYCISKGFPGNSAPERGPENERKWKRGEGESEM